MSVPVQNIQGNMIQPQNIVINQVPLSHSMMTNVNNSNGMPMATAIGQIEHHQQPEMKTMVVETMPIQGPNIIQSNMGSVMHSVKQSQTAASSSSETAQVLSKQRLQDVIRDTDPSLNLEEEVEEIILNYVDEFVDKVLNGAALIAKIRPNVNTIEVRDVQQYLTRNYDMWTPGFGTDELKPLKRSFTTESHKQRLALIKKTLKKY